MSKKNVIKVLDDYFMQNAYYTAKDRLRLRDNREIVNCGTLMAYIHEDYVDDYNANTYLIVTLQDYKSQPSWKRDKQELIEIASSPEYGMRIIFVPELDIGFGKKPNEHVIDFHKVLFENYLLKAAKFSKDNIKTAVAAIIPAKGNLSDDELVAITYNQIDLDGEVLHAEKILTEYLNSLSEYNAINEYIFVSILEPCYECLNAMLECKGSKIYWAYNHKDKWETDEYIQLTNDIWAPNIRHPITNRPITYFKLLNLKINKFMEKNEEKCK